MTECPEKLKVGNCVAAKHYPNCCCALKDGKKYTIDITIPKKPIITQAISDGVVINIEKQK